MNEDQVIGIIRAFVDKQFPKECPSCGHLFKTWKEYLQNTARFGKLRCYDAERQDWLPESPLGTFAFSKCNYCKNSMSISISGMDTETIWQLLAWAEYTISEKGIPLDKLLVDLRTKINRQVLMS